MRINGVSAMATSVQLAMGATKAHAASKHEM